MQTVAHRRRKYFVDAQVQGAILWQAGCYWLFGSVLFTLTVFIYRVIPPCLSGEPLDFGKIWYHLAPMVVSSVVFLPVVMLVIVSPARASTRSARGFLRRAVLRIRTNSITRCHAWRPVWKPTLQPA